MHWRTVTRLCLKLQRSFAAIKARALMNCRILGGWRNAAAKGVHIIKLGSSCWPQPSREESWNRWPSSPYVGGTIRGKGQLGIFLCGLMIGFYWFATQLQDLFLESLPPLVLRPLSVYFIRFNKNNHGE